MSTTRRSTQPAIQADVVDDDEESLTPKGPPPEAARTGVEMVMAPPPDAPPAEVTYIVDGKEVDPWGQPVGKTKKADE